MFRDKVNQPKVYQHKIEGVDEDFLKDANFEDKVCLSLQFLSRGQRYPNLYQLPMSKNKAKKSLTSREDG